MPFVPALVILVSERRQRWIRLHAARSLIFFVLLVGVQVALFAALVLLGGMVGTLPAAAVIGFVFYGLYLLAGVLGLVIWLRLIADAMGGRKMGSRLLNRWATRLEGALARVQRMRRALPAEGSTARISRHAHYHT